MNTLQLCVLVLHVFSQFSSGGARIIPNDSDLTVFPDACELFQHETISSPNNSGNCGVQRLDGYNHPWILRSEDGVYHDIHAIVPGDILTDLQEAGIIDDPLYENNFLDQRHVWMGEEKVMSNGTSCYSSKRTRTRTAQQSDFGSSKHEHRKEGKSRMKEEYRIPHLERRTRTWIYETNFAIENNFDRSFLRNDRRKTTAGARMASYPNSHSRRYALVVEGIKMGATIQVNGIPIGNVTDQFLRYIFPLSESMLHIGLSGTNALSIMFDPEIDTGGRFMACSGGWDWAPYSMAAEASCSSRRVLSFGIFKPIYVIEVSRVAIVDVVPKLRYQGDPTVDISGGKFSLAVDVHLQEFWEDFTVLESLSCGEIVFRASFIEDQILKLNDSPRNTIHSSPNEIIVSLNVEVNVGDIKLWWPNGMIQGEQSLYSLRVSYRDSCLGYTSQWIERSIGFRSVALVTHNEDEDIPLEGTGNFGMYFRVNGIAVWARGANVVPMAQFEGRLSDEAHMGLVESAVNTNMNMLRVWGGGMIMPLSFYNACDLYGIMLFHDLMFVEEQFHALEKTITVENEIRYVVRSLCRHPSIVIWNGCNECTLKSNDLYATFALAVVAKEDGTRPVWWSSPSSGFSTGVSGIDGIPNGQKLVYNLGQNESTIEEHGPYNHGYSNNVFTVNGHKEKGSKYETRTPFEFKRENTGLSYPNTFVSEFGASVFPSFESMSAVLNEDNWGLHGNPEMVSNCSIVYENANECQGLNVLSQRNYPCDSHVKAFFGEKHLDKVGKKYFQLQLYQCLLAQTLWMKGTIEELRSKNSFGSLIWQMNDNWQSGSWGLLEYGAYSDESGRWKPLMYLLKRSLFQSVFATCGASTGGVVGRCYARNDGVAHFDGKLVIENWNFSGEVNIVFSKSISLPPNGYIEYFDLDMKKFNLQTTCTVIRVLDELNNEQMGRNIVFWKLPKQLDGLIKDPGLVLHSVVAVEGGSLELTLETKQVAFYIFLASSIHGDFDDNAFSMAAGSRKKVRFAPAVESLTDGSHNMEQSFAESLRMDHLGMAINDRTAENV